MNKSPQLKSRISSLLYAVSINTLLCISQIWAADRALIVDPLEMGDFPVGSSNFTINRSALDLLRSQGGDASSEPLMFTLTNAGSASP